MSKVSLEKLNPAATREEIITAYNRLIDELVDILQNIDEENTTEEYEEGHANG